MREGVWERVRGLVCVCVCVCERERERERVGDREREKDHCDSNDDAKTLTH